MTKFTPARYVLWDLLRPKCVCGRGSAPDPAGGAYSAPPYPLAGGEGARCPLPKNPTPALASRPLGPRAERSHCSHFTKRPLRRTRYDELLVHIIRSERTCPTIARSQQLYSLEACASASPLPGCLHSAQCTAKCHVHCA